MAFHLLQHFSSLFTAPLLGYDRLESFNFNSESLDPAFPFILPCQGKGMGVGWRKVWNLVCAEYLGQPSLSLGRWGCSSLKQFLTAAVPCGAVPSPSENQSPNCPPSMALGDPICLWGDQGERGISGSVKNSFSQCKVETKKKNHF